MREIIITLKPTLSDISDPSRLMDYVHQVERIMSDNIDLCLEKVGEKILEYAKENAEQGYMSVPHTGNRPVVWPARDVITNELYRASPYHVEGLVGLDTGRKNLINSLERGGNDNIFDRAYREIGIGTKFRHAAILEKGGIRRMVPNIGFTDEGRPKKWLLDAMAAGIISPDVVRSIQERFQQPRYIPPRPFLEPALWHLRDTQQHTGICAVILLAEMYVDLALEKIRVSSGDGIIVYE